MFLFNKFGSVEHKIQALGNREGGIEGIAGTEIAVVLECASGTFSVNNNRPCDIEAHVTGCWHG